MEASFTPMEVRTKGKLFNRWWTPRGGEGVNVTGEREPQATRPELNTNPNKSRSGDPNGKLQQPCNELIVTGVVAAVAQESNVDYDALGTAPVIIPQFTTKQSFQDIFAK